MISGLGVRMMIHIRKEEKSLCDMRRQETEAG